MIEDALITTYSTEHLDKFQIQLLCRALDVPTPTPDINFETCLRSKGLTPADAYARLATTTHPAVMIAAAALRTSVRLTRLPPDPRLNPRPLPPQQPMHPAAKTAGDGARAGKRTPARPGTTPATPSGMYDAQILATVASNPKKPGSLRFTRYELYAVGLTIGQLKARGLRPRDIEGDFERGHITFTNPDALPQP